MMRGDLKYYLLLVGLLIVYFVVMMLRPQEPSPWVPSFSKGDKVPYGSRLLYERLPDLFEEGEVSEVKTSVYNLFEDSAYQLYEADTYVAINTELPWDPYETRNFLRFIREGNYALLSAMGFSQSLRDSLEIEESEPLLWMAKTDSGRAAFVNPVLAEDSGYVFEEALQQVYFSSFDTTRTTVLARNAAGHPNLIRVTYGEGSVMLSTTPFLFTNYHLLHKNHYRFVAGVFSYFPQDTRILWDEYYKYWNLKAIAEGRSSGRLGYILNQRALRWAFWLLIGSLLVFSAFELKRKQRIVPLAPPLPNLTLEFTETIGRLYFQSGDHHNLAEKKIKVFLEQLRSHYFLRTDAFDNSFFRILSGKSGVPESDIRALFHLIELINRHPSLSEEQLIDLNNRIDAFYQKAGMLSI